MGIESNEGNLAQQSKSLQPDRATGLIQFSDQKRTKASITFINSLTEIPSGENKSSVDVNKNTRHSQLGRSKIPTVNEFVTTVDSGNLAAGDEKILSLTVITANKFLDHDREVSIIKEDLNKAFDTLEEQYPRREKPTDSTPNISRATLIQIAQEGRPIPVAAESLGVTIPQLYELLNAQNLVPKLQSKEEILFPNVLKPPLSRNPVSKDDFLEKQISNKSQERNDSTDMASSEPLKLNNNRAGYDRRRDFLLKQFGHEGESFSDMIKRVLPILLANRSVKGAAETMQTQPITIYRWMSEFNIAVPDRIKAKRNVVDRAEDSPSRGDIAIKKGEQVIINPRVMNGSLTEKVPQVNPKIEDNATEPIQIDPVQQRLFEERVIALNKKLVAFAGRRFGGDTDCAEEIVQQAYIKIWNLVLKGRQVSDFGDSYIYTVVNNLAIDALRRKQRLRNKFRSEVDASDPAHQIVDERSETDLKAVEGSEAVDKIRKVIDDVIGEDEKDRIIFEEAIINEVPLEEVGRMLGKTGSAMKAASFRLRVRLKAALTKNKLSPQHLNA